MDKFFSSKKFFPRNPDTDVFDSEIRIRTKVVGIRTTDPNLILSGVLQSV
jgi:hypothetical protein